MQAAISFAIVLLAFSVQSGESIKCYLCNSQQDPKCMDPFGTAENESMLKECSSDFVRKSTEFFNSASTKFSEFASNLGIGSNKPTTINTDFACLKVEFTNADKSLSITRGCVPKSTDPCKLVKDAQGEKNTAFCEMCEKDGCNGANSIQVALLTVLVPFAAFFLAQLH